MKANELMIGDWVYSASMTPRKVQYLDGAKSDSIGVADHLNFESRINPIPLTKGILEKNGFKKLDFSHYQINDRTLVLDADGKWDAPSWHWVVTEMCTNSKGHNVVLDYYVATINNVHELQHALRLCGLKELADNFKI